MTKIPQESQNLKLAQPLLNKRQNDAKQFKLSKQVALANQEIESHRRYLLKHVSDPSDHPQYSHQEQEKVFNFLEQVVQYKEHKVEDSNYVSQDLTPYIENDNEIPFFFRNQSLSLKSKPMHNSVDQTNGLYNEQFVLPIVQRRTRRKNDQFHQSGLNSVSLPFQSNYVLQSSIQYQQLNQKTSSNLFQQDNQQQLQIHDLNHFVASQSMKPPRYDKILRGNLKSQIDAHRSFLNQSEMRPESQNQKFTNNILNPIPLITSYAESTTTVKKSKIEQNVVAVNLRTIYEKEKERLAQENQNNAVAPAVIIMTHVKMQNVYNDAKVKLDESSKKKLANASRTHITSLSKAIKTTAEITLNSRINTPEHKRLEEITLTGLRVPSTEPKMVEID